MMCAVSLAPQAAKKYSSRAMATNVANRSGRRGVASKQALALAKREGGAKTRGSLKALEDMPVGGLPEQSMAL